MGFVRRVSDAEFKISDLVRLAAEQSLGLRLQGTKPGGEESAVFSGTLLGYEVQPGLVMTGGDITYLTDDVIRSEAEPGILCGVLLSDEPERMHVEGHGTIVRERGRAAILAFRDRTHFTLQDMKNHRSRGAGFVLRPSFFDRFGDSVTNDNLAALRDFGETPMRYALLPRSNALVHIASRCVDHPYSGHLQELFLESNTLAFVVEVAEQLAHAKRTIALIGKRHYERVLEARDILDASLVTPPKTLELTRRVGVNLTTLQANFKAVFGTTIFGYVRVQRLEMARVLLTEYRLPVAEAGYRVGFGSPSAFTAAYRRHFGHPPSQELAPR